MSRPRKKKVEGVQDQPVTKKQDKVNKDSIVNQQLNSQIFNKHGVKSIDELLGERDGEYRDFKTEDEYKEFLDNLNLTDLQEHASRVGVLPKEDRDTLIRVLSKEFKIRKSVYYGTVEHGFNYPKPISPEVERILAEGR